MQETDHADLIKKEKFRKKFFRDLMSWVGTSIVLITMDLFLSGSITWSRFPVFFYGIFMVMQFFRFINVEYFGGDYHEKPKRWHRRNKYEAPVEEAPVEDYSDELLRREEREYADLKEYRKPGKPWKDEDLV